MKSWEWLYKEHVLPHIICRDSSRDRDASFCGGPWQLCLSAAARWPPCLPGPLTWCHHPPAPILQPCRRKAISPLSAVSHRKKTQIPLFLGIQRMTFPFHKCFLTYTRHQEDLAAILGLNQKCLFKRHVSKKNYKMQQAFPLHEKEIHLWPLCSGQWLFVT